MAVLTGVELVGQRPVSALVGGSSHGNTTTVGSVTDLGGGAGAAPSPRRRQRPPRPQQWRRHGLRDAQHVAVRVLDGDDTGPQQRAGVVHHHVAHDGTGHLLGRRRRRDARTGRTSTTP